MPSVKSWGKHGTVRRYRQGGCDDLRGGNQGEGMRCDKCKLAYREFNQGQRAGQANPPKGSNVASLDKRRREHKKTVAQAVSAPTPPKTGQNKANSAPQPPKCMGNNESAVWKELEPYRENHPARVEMALTAARILDDPERVSLHGTILRQLDQIMERLTGGRKSKSKGRLAAVQAMTARAR